MSNHEVVVAVIGLDQPGVIACVSSVITRLGCNIREMTQSTLHDQFAGIYLVDKPEEVTNETLNSEIEKAVALKKMRLTIVTRDYEEPTQAPIPSEPFVISVYGPDRNDIVGTFAHIFGEQVELGYDYLQLLYLRPLQRLPVLLLVSDERNTGKTTFLNLLKSIFGGNVTFNTNEDFRSQFNDDWTGKLLICVDEVLLNRREDSERIKNLSTARSYKAEAKGRDRREVEFFGKFVLCSNNERNPVLIEAAETRYWVRRVPPLPYDDQHLLAKMRAEIPGLLFYLQQRTLSSYEESRMWFAPRLLVTDALRRIVHYNRSKTETEMLSIIRDIMDAENLAEYRFDVSDMVNMLEIRGIRVDHPTVRRILAENWQLRPAPPTYYQRYTITYNGETQRQDSKTARVYTVTREQLGGLLNDAAM